MRTKIKNSDKATFERDRDMSGWVVTKCGKIDIDGYVYAVQPGDRISLKGEVTRDGNPVDLALLTIEELLA